MTNEIKFRELIYPIQDNKLYTDTIEEATGKLIKIQLIAFSNNYPEGAILLTMHIND